MKAALHKIRNEVWYFDDDGRRVDGVHDRITGDVSGIRGDVSGIRGNVDECQLTAEERKRGINVDRLIC